MDNRLIRSIYLRGFLALFLWSICGKCYADIVQVETSRDGVLQPCVFPPYFSATITGRRLRGRVLLSLKRNEATLTSREVILMSSKEHDGILFESQKATGRSAAYHSIQLNAAFVLRCAHYTKNYQGHYLVMEGSFFMGEKKFLLMPANASVTMTASKVISSYIMSETREYSNPGDHGFIASKKEVLESVLKVKTDKKERQTRSAENFVLDILPVVDYELYQRWLTQNSNDQIQTSNALSDYLANVFTSIDMRLNTLSLHNGITLSLSVIPPYLSTSAATSPYSENNKEADGGGNFRVNATKILEDFKTWISSTPGLPAHDHAMLFSSLSLYAGADDARGFNITRGLAYVGTICQPNGQSTSVVEDTGAYQSEGVAAHELGHSLGSLHDGQENRCNSYDRFVMSNGSYPITSANTGNSWTFSSCSSTSIADTIMELEADDQLLNDCLRSASTNGQTPGAVIAKDFDDLCTSYYGSDSFVCRGVNFSPLNQMCNVLHCRIPGTNTCGRLFTAAGTCCGDGKYCLSGQCVAAPASYCDVDESCPFGDQPGVVVNGQTCAQMHPAYCYNDDINIKCCATCKQHETNFAGCLYGDKQLGCNVLGCGGTLDNSLSYDVICCGTCTEDCVDTSTLEREGQTWTCSQYLQQYGVSECYRTALHSTACCATCESARSDSSACPFGDNRPSFNCHELPPLGRLCTNQEAGYCCETCPAIATNLSTEATQAPTDASTPDSISPTDSTTPDPTDNGGNQGQNQNDCQPGEACDHAVSLSCMGLLSCTVFSLITLAL